MAVNTSGVTIGPTGRLIVDFVNTYYPKTSQIRVTSAFRATEADGGTWSHHNGQTYGGSPTAAIDFGQASSVGSYPGHAASVAMRDIAKWLFDHFRDLTVEMFHTTPFSDDNGFNVRNGQVSSGIPDHGNHVHYATSAANVAKMYERAKAWGWKPVNGTSSPTPVPVPAPPTPGVTTIFGWDASDFDWDRGARPSHVTQYIKDGGSFFTHKITEGTKNVHRHAGEMLLAAGAAGAIGYGFYVVPRTPGNNGHGSIRQQVDFAIAEANRQYPNWKNDPKFFWQVDSEHWEYDKVSGQHGCEMANMFKETGKKVAHYAPRWAYGDSVPTCAPLWASDYTGSGAPDHWWTQWDRRKGWNGSGVSAYSGQSPAILQFSSDAVSGGQHTTDANAFRGSKEDFINLFGSKPASPPPPPPEDPRDAKIRDLEAQILAAAAKLKNLKERLQAELDR